jgi:drug/metabolite transporter (DMT)-like permease
MGYLKIVAALLIWSTLGIFVRKVDLPNSALIFYPSLIAGLIQLLVLASNGSLKKSVTADHDYKSILLLLIIPISFLANSFLFYFAFRNTTIANAVLTHYTAPVFVAFMAPFFLKEKISSSAWSAIILSSIGLWFILKGSSPDKISPSGSSEYLGIIAGALSGLAYAFLIITIRSIATKFSSLFIICVQNLVVALLILPFIFKVTVSLEHVPYLLILGIVHSTIAPLLYVQGFRTVKANEAAILGYSEPVGAIIMAFVFLHEIPGKTALMGGLLILFSGYLILRAKIARS